MSTRADRLPPFRERLARGCILSDGAMGTMLQQAGLPVGASPEAWNLTRPDAVLAVHRAYRAAGAEILQTNTFGGTRSRLAACGLADRMREVNRAAVALAREAAAEAAYVAGTIGPAGRPPTTEHHIRTEYDEQVEALLEAAVDLFIVETICDPREGAAAIEAIRAVTDLTILATFTPGPDAQTLAGEPIDLAAASLIAAGADAVGANCGDGPASVYAAIDTLRAAFPNAPLVAQPSAGLPVMEDGRPTYALTPDAFATWAARAAALAHVIGGCCGTTPAHIAAAVRTTGALSR